MHFSLSHGMYQNVDISLYNNFLQISPAKPFISMWSLQKIFFVWGFNNKRAKELLGKIDNDDGHNNKWMKTYRIHRSSPCSVHLFSDNGKYFDVIADTFASSKWHWKASQLHWIKYYFSLSFFFAYPQLDIFSYLSLLTWLKCIKQNPSRCYRCYLHSADI
jgi:hypothetical protein